MPAPPRLPQSLLIDRLRLERRLGARVSDQGAYGGGGVARYREVQRRRLRGVRLRGRVRAVAQECVDELGLVGSCRQVKRSVAGTLARLIVTLRVAKRRGRTWRGGGSSR